MPTVEHFITSNIAGCSPAQFCSGTPTIATTALAQKTTQVDANLPLDPVALFGVVQNSLILPGGHTLLYEIDAYAEGFRSAPATTWGWTCKTSFFGFGADVTLEEVWICKVNAACNSLQTIGKTQNIGKSFGNNEEYLLGVVGAALTLAPGDKIITTGIFLNVGTSPESAKFVTQKQGDVVGYIRSPLVVPVASGVPRRLVNGHGQPLLAGGGLVV